VPFSCFTPLFPTFLQYSKPAKRIDDEEKEAVGSFFFKQQKCHIIILSKEILEERLD
jgi:hypothetical protein